MAAEKNTLGVVGLGIMGGSFAKNLVAGGFRVVGFDPAPSARRAAVKAGVELAHSAADVAAAAPTVITSLPTPQALQATVEEIAAAKLPGRVVIEASTFTLEDKQQAADVLRDAGHTALDCPISGTGAQAKVKDLVVYASGDSKAIARNRDVFLGFARAVHDLGEFGNGSKMKYVANLLVAIHNVASAEAMVLGMKAGLAPQQIFDLVTAGAGNSRVFELRAPMMVADRYDDPTMKVSVWQKDMSVIGDYAQQLGCPTPLFSATLPVYAAAMSTGHDAHDTAAVCAVLEAMAGIKRKSGAKSPDKSRDKSPNKSRDKKSRKTKR
ncbi:MAG TPA: NAD(P)-dependent oxidoreductase [Xanthobacteraceae bacterium]|jgi:3-hydroxyisobutyrate dehydrogenase-like beta-hydroxyacid dehydrogenase